jgi:DNA (cytosine-5)-methyltransferase 1
MVREYTKENPLRVFTAFSGYDSQCLALNRLGIPYELVGWSEIDKAAIVAHNALFPQYADRNYGDISKIDWSVVPDFDLFTYSSPCTDFSNAGAQAGGEEGSGTRSSLLWECRKTILAKKPKYLMFENVKALTSEKFFYLFDKWCKELESYGYANFYQVLNAKNYGVPQSRERIFMISILRTEDEPDPYYEFPMPVKLEKTVEDILEDDVPEKYYMKPEVTERYIEIMNQEYPDEVGEDIEIEDEGLW